MKGGMLSGPIAMLPDITKNLDAQSNAHNKILQLQAYQSASLTSVQTSQRLIGSYQQGQPLTTSTSRPHTQTAAPASVPGGAMPGQLGSQPPTELTHVRNTIDGANAGGRRPPSNRRMLRVSDDGKKQRYDPTANAEAKFNTQHLKLAEDGASQFAEPSEKHLKKVQDIYKKKDRDSFGGKKNRAQSMKRSKEAQNSSQASTAAAAAVLIYQRKQGGKSLNRNQQRTMATNMQLAHGYQTNKSNLVGESAQQNSDLLLPLFPGSSQPISGYGTQLGAPGTADPVADADGPQYSQLPIPNHSLTSQADAQAPSISQ